jgi:hypothetical protein
VTWVESLSTATAPESYRGISLPEGEGGSRDMTTPYGADHQRERQRRLDAMADGDPCCRCGRPMYHGQLLHLDHAEGGGYLGLAHASCNLSAGGRKGLTRRWARRRGFQPLTSSEPCQLCGKPGCRAFCRW